MRLVFQVAREDRYLLAFLVDLRTQAVVFVLRHHRPHFGDDGFGSGEPLGELRVDRFADPDIQGCHRVLCLFLVGMLEDGPTNEAEIGGFIVGPLQQLALLGIVPPGLRQRVEHGRVADAQPQVPQQDAHHVFGGHVVNMIEQVGQTRALLFDCAFAGRLCDGSQANKHLVDTQRRGNTSCFAAHLPGHQSQIPERRIERLNVLWRGVIRQSERLRHAFLCHPHLQRHEEWRDPALDQVADLLDLPWAFDRTKQLREQLDQRQAGAGSFQFLKGVRKASKFHGMSSFFLNELSKRFVRPARSAYFCFHSGSLTWASAVSVSTCCHPTCRNIISWKGKETHQHGERRRDLLPRTHERSERMGDRCPKRQPACWLVSRLECSLETLAFFESFGKTVGDKI